MKKVLKLLCVLSLVLFTACTSLFKDKGEKKVYTKEQAKDWQTTIAESLKANALIPEWYGDENPILYLKKSGKMNEKEFRTLDAIGQKSVNDINEEDLDAFGTLVNKYNKKLPRKFYLDDENIKNGKGLTEKMVMEANNGVNPASYIAKSVATEKEWNEIVAFSQKKDLTESDITNLRKLLNKFIKRDNFFNKDVLLEKEVSTRVMQLIKISEKSEKSDIEKNNISAKSLYIYYPEYFSKMEKWDN